MNRSAPRTGTRLKGLVLLLASTFIISSPEASGAEKKAVMTQFYSLPIHWKGQKIGDRAFQIGQIYEVVEVIDNAVILRDKKQTFTLPSSVVKVIGSEEEMLNAASAPEQTETLPPADSQEMARESTSEGKSTTASGITPAGTGTPPSPSAIALRKPEPSASLSEEGETREVPEIPATASPEDMDRFGEYLDEALAFRQEFPAQVRYIQYGRMNAMNPRELQAEVRRLVKKQEALSPSQTSLLKHLQIAFVLYSRGEWQGFEREIDKAQGFRE